MPTFKNNMKPNSSINTSDLYSGEKISRSSLQMDVLGDIDELNSVLGVAYCHVQNTEIQQNIYSIQENLITVSSELATTQKKLAALPSRIDDVKLNTLKDKIETLKHHIKMPTTFVIPGKNLSSAHIHQARTIARRCERKITKLFENKELYNQIILQWFNRLGAYLFFLALSEEQH